MIEEIRRKVRDQEYEYSLHAVDQSIVRRISRLEVEEAMQVGEVIENYPSDKYGPSCLILGRTSQGRPIHIQCTHPERLRVKVITLYEPSPDEWIDFRTRR
jgi:hypothetical protein